MSCLTDLVIHGIKGITLFVTSKLLRLMQKGMIIKTIPMRSVSRKPNRVFLFSDLVIHSPAPTVLTDIG